MFASAIIIHIRGGRDEESAPGMAASVSAASVLPFSSLSTVPAGMRATTLLRATASLGPLDAAAPLRRAAKYTVDKYVNNGMVIGLGSGPASGLAIKYLGQQLRAGALEDIVGIATSVLSASEAAKAGIPLDDYQESSQINIAFDDADIIEEETLVAVIGQRRLQGGESIIQEKSILTAAKKLVFMITESKYRGTLEGSVPVLVQSLNWMDTAEVIDDLFLGDAEVWRRPSVGHADPLGGDYPLITKEGHNVLDVIFTSPITSLAEVAESLDKIDGVVDHGVISKFPCAAVIASDGGLQVVDNVAIKAFGNSAE